MKNSKLKIARVEILRLLEKETSKLSVFYTEGIKSINVTIKLKGTNTDRKIIMANISRLEDILTNENELIKIYDIISDVDDIDLNLNNDIIVLLKSKKDGIRKIKEMKESLKKLDLVHLLSLAAIKEDKEKIKSFLYQLIMYSTLDALDNLKDNDKCNFYDSFYKDQEQKTPILEKILPKELFDEENQLFKHFSAFGDIFKYREFDGFIFSDLKFNFKNSDRILIDDYIQFHDVEISIEELKEENHIKRIKKDTLESYIYNKVPEVMF